MIKSSQLSLKSKFLIIIWLIMFVTLFTFTYLYNNLQKTEYLSGIDKKLETAALMAKAIMPNNYHDTLIDENSVSEEDYLKIIHRYNEICVQLGLQYLWSNLILHDKIVFTSSTSTSKDVSKGDHALFFDVHSDPGAFQSVIDAQKPVYSTFRNEWGTGRMILIPFFDKYERMYVFGASIPIDELEEKLVNINTNTALIFVLILIGITLIVLVITNRITQPILEITSVAEKIAGGKYGDHTSTRVAYPELEVLSKSINKMSDSILENKNELEIILKQKTHRLQRSEKYIEQIVENMAEGVVLVNKHGVFQKVNPAILRLFQYSEEEIVGKNISLIIPDDSTHDHNQYLIAKENYFTQIVNKPRELKAKRKDGSVFPMEINVSSMETEDGVSYIGIIHDRTERVRQENILKKAKDEAESANRAKSDFLSSMSHELRTPLSAILGFSQILLLDESNTDEVITCAEEIKEAGNHLLELINQVLEYAKLEPGILDVSPQSVSLQNILQQSIKWLQETAEKNQIDISLSIDKDYSIWADPLRTKEVLINLLSNAIKYNHAHGTVKIYVSDPHHGKIRVYVEDTGVGIDNSNKDDIFKPFTRLGYERSDIKGTGIGLTITKKLITAMNGDIGFESEINKGSTFWIELPLTSNASLLTHITKEKDLRPLNSDSSKKIQLLYIEDNHANSFLMKQIVNSLPNITLLLEADAERGIKRAQKERPDIILMDIDLPGISGIEALSHLAQNHLTQDIPVIAVSAAAMPDDIEKGLAAGFRAYVTKPFNVRELVSTIEKYKSS